MEDQKIEEAKDLIKQTYEDGEAEINGRKYTFSKFVHAERRKVFAYMSSIQELLVRGDFSFLDNSTYLGIEKLIFDKVLFEGVQLSKKQHHFEQYPEDYILLVSTCLQVISYPFLKGSPTA